MEGLSALVRQHERACASAALKRWGTRAIAVLFLAQTMSGGPASAQQSSAAADFREGVAAQQRGELDHAAEAYRRAIERDPKLAEAHANLGAVLARLGQHEQAIASYERALTINPRLTAARVNLGLAHYRVGSLAAAADQFKAAYAADPTLLQARQLLGLVLVEIGRDAEAIPLLEASADAAPNEPAILFALGRAYTRQSDPRSEAIAERLAQTPEGRPLWHQLRGLAFQRNDDHQKALEAFEAAAALNADLPQLWVNIGVSRLFLGNRRGARDAFMAALNRTERDADAHVYLAWIDEQDGQLADARHHAERAVALDANLPESRGLLGRILLKDGSSAEAARQLELAVTAAPQNASWHFLLAQAYQRSGQSAAAAREFGEARRLKELEVARERKNGR